MALQIMSANKRAPWSPTGLARIGCGMVEEWSGLVWTGYGMEMEWIQAGKWSGKRLPGASLEATLTMGSFFHNLRGDGCDASHGFAFDLRPGRVPR